MKPRDIVLDFTSLLDIIMIILFWFIIQSQNAVEEAKSDASEAKSNAEQIIEDYNDKLDQLDKEWEDAHNANAHAADNQHVLNNFEKGLYLRFDLVKNNQDRWILKVSQDTSFLFEVDLDVGELDAMISGKLVENDIGKNDVIIGLFTFDGNEEDSNLYVSKVKKSLGKLSRSSFTNMYIADNNISRMKGE